MARKSRARPTAETFTGAAAQTGDGRLEVRDAVIAPAEPDPVVEVLPSTRQQQDRMADALCILSAWLLRLHKARAGARTSATEPGEEGP